jgi:acyl transferase domain-containing protein/NAD(P)-dependent dehydrogenase (short-subunit alcohol dehydrogenase family)
LAWKVTHGPRRALVNSFGFSGTNAQIIVEEYVRPGDESQGIVQGNAQEDVYYPVLLSGRSKAHLRRTVSHFMNEIDDISPIAALAGVSLDGRALMSERLGLVARSSGELKEKLRLIDSAVDGDSLPGGVFRYSQPDNGVRQKVAFLFTGQGSQYPMMGRALMARYQEFMEPLEECRKILRGELPIDLFDILFDPTRSEKLLSQPLFAQPALCSIEYATARLWMALGVRPDALMGHSMGEYVAAAVAGCISLEDAMRLVVGRVKLVDTLPRGGEMGAVNLAHDRVAARLKELGVQVVVAAINGPDNTVISGNGDHVKQALAAFEKDGVKVKLLAVGWASHSPLVDPILEEFGKVASSVTYRKPELNLVSNLTGTWVGDEDIRGDYWVQHLRSAVQFNKGIKVLLSDGHKVYIEMAPGTALLSMGQLDPLSDESCLWIPSMRKDRPDLQQFSEGVAALAVRGRKIHVGRALKEPNWRSKGRLPLTPMLKQRYWLAPRVPVVDASQKGEHPLLQQKWDMAEDSGRTVYTSHLSINDFGFIADHKVYGHVIVPGATYCEIALAAARLRFGTERIAISDVSVVRALRLEPNKMRQLQLISQAERNSGLEKWKLFSRPIREDGSHGPWALHASGSMSRLGEAEIRTGPSVGELSEVVSSQGHYKKCALHGIEYGKAFQGIVSLWSKGASGGCVIKKPEGVSTTRYLFHPTLLDACFQTVYFAMNSIKGADGADIHPAFMPVGFEAIRIHSKIPNDLRATVRMRDNPSDRAMTCDIYAFDESGSLVAEIIGFSLVEATPDALKRAIRDEESLDDWMYSVIWQSETSATAIDTAGKNAAFRIVRAPTQFSSLTHSIPMAEFEGEPTAVSQDLAVVVDLTGMDPRSSDDMQRACLEVGQVHLKLRKKGHSKERRLLIVLTKGAGAVEGSEARLASASAYAVSSYVRAVIQEHPELKTRLIDLDRELGVDELQGLAQAAFESSEWQWLHRNGRLFRPRFQRVRSVRAHSDVESRNVFKDGMVVVTGGTGAIGLELIDWLVTRREVKDLIVIARRLPQGQAQERFAKLESQGARILICQADLSNEAGIDVARQQVMRSGKRISAVIHAAGVMNMCVTDSETAQSLQMGTGAKVDGLRALDSILADQPTTPLVLFSSASAWIPASGQASYASSNGFLDGYSIQSRAEGRRVVSINWGAWRGLGMATQSSSGDKAIDWDAGGFGSFDASHGFQLLERALLDDLSGTIFVPVDWEKVGRHFQGDDLNPILKDLVVSDQSSPDIVEADVAKSSQSLKAQLLLLPSNDERLEALEEKVRGEAAKVLGLASFNDVPSSEGLMSLGMDSLMAVEFRNRLKKSVGDDGAKPLPATLIFAYPNCQAIAQFILDDVLQARVPEEAADESLGDDELDRLISESGVNEKELQAMIQKLKGSA